MFGEISWTHIDRLATRYGAASTLVDRLQSLEVELAEVCSNLQHRNITMTDLSQFLSPRVDPLVESTRAVAWISQHVCNARAWCVGQKIVEAPKSKKAHSPLVKQMERLGVKAQPISYATMLKQWRDTVEPQDRLDSLLFDPRTDTVYLVKGQSSSTFMRISPHFTVAKAADRETLFGDSKAVFCGVRAQRDALAALCFAMEIMRTAFPSLNVRGFFANIEECGGSGRFQFHEVAGRIESLEGPRLIGLDEFPVVASHEDYAIELKEDPEALYRLPRWSESDYLKKAPVDLPIRSLMILQIMRRLQEDASLRLCLRSPNDIAELVSEHYLIHYPKNMARHDLDRLQRVGLLEWAPNGSVTLGLTASGVARCEILAHRFNPMVPRSSARVLDAVRRQEEFWFQTSAV